jgi:hypothetical protein
MNNYRKYLGREDKIQEAVIKYALQVHRAKAIPMNIEHKKTPFERYKAKIMGNYKGIVDLFIPYPNKDYHGLFIELKTADRKVFKSNGELYANGKETHAAQIKEIERLNKSGYLALMVFGLDEAMKVLDKYFKNI